MEAAEIVVVTANIATALRRVAEHLAQHGDVNITEKIDEVMPVLHFLTQGLDQLIDDDEISANSVLNAIDLVRERMSKLLQKERHIYDTELRWALSGLIEAGAKVLDVLQRIARAEIEAANRPR
jgi:hypothetical protein